MRHEVRDLDCKASVAAGDPCDVSDLREKVIQLVSSSFVGSIDVEGSIDGDTWAPLVTALTGPQLVSITVAVKSVRLNTTAHSGGSMTALVAGFNTRTA